MTRDEITRLALRDAGTEKLDNLRSAAGTLDSNRREAVHQDAETHVRGMVA